MKEKLKKERKIKQKSHITLHTCHNSGITLVALIITIIVLLILAVVAIRAVQGDGIISKAKEAKSKTEQAQADEEQKLLELEYQMAKENGSFTGTFNEYLLKKEYDKKVADGTFTGTFEEYVVIQNVKNYGKKVVGYTSKGAGLDTLVWRVFYQDNKNVYLISETADKNYPVNNLSFYTYSNSTYTYTKKAIVEKYNSGADVSAQGKALMPKASSLFTTENTNENIIATAYMCDPEVWDAYTDAEGKASFAMGGPTIELFEKSYNAYQKSINGTNEINTTVNSYGYSNGGTGTNWFTTEQNNGIYRLKSSGNWWLISPSYGTSYGVRGINGVADNSGNFANGSVYSGYSARPIVCIPVANFNYELAD